MKPQALTPDDRARIETLRSFLDAARPLDSEAPSQLAHLRITQGDEVLNVLFTGPSDDSEWDSLSRAPSPEARAFMSEEGERVLIVDWRESPLSAVFLSTPVGKGYRLHLQDRVLEGRVIDKSLLRIDGGDPIEIVAQDARPIFEPRSSEARDRAASLIDISLDAAQKSIVKGPSGRSLLLLGEAGHGKTTVALHRLAHLLRTSKERLRAAIIVPAEGLRDLLELLTKQLRIRVDVLVYERFARQKARRAFADIPRRESENASAFVIRLKRDPALGILLRTMAKRRPGHLDDDPEAIQRRRRAWVAHADLQHLFGDSALLERLRDLSNHRITSGMIADVLEHTHVQFSQTSEEEWSHVVDKERLVPVDERSLDEGTPMQDARTIDAEDYAVLFELDRQRAELRGREATKIAKRYDLIVIDEAQEFASLELRLIGRSLSPSGTIIVAGDADQQLDPAACFDSWERTMEDLGCQVYERAFLEVGYRCPPRIQALARNLRSDSPSGGAIEAEVNRFDSRLHLSAWLINELRVIEEADPKASIAIICRTPITATRLARTLSHGIANRLNVDGRFVFRSGVTITSVDRVKGLEFDYVVVPDASRVSYPQSPEARRALYVAITRARHQLVLASVGEATPLLAKPNS